MEKADAAVNELTNHVEECAKKFVECMRFYKLTPKKRLHHACRIIPMGSTAASQQNASI